MARTWQASHLLVWSPSDGGEPQRCPVMLVPDREAPGQIVALRERDRSQSDAEWTYDTALRKWQWLGCMVGPDGRPGSVTVRRLDGSVELTPRGMRVIF